MEFVKRNLWEIQRSWALRYAGATIAFSHVATILWWLYGSHPIQGRPRGPQVCWNFFTGCEPLHFLFNIQLTPLFYAYLALAVIPLLGFLLNRAVGFAWWLSVFNFLTMLVFIFADSRLLTNTHVLLIFVQIAYLFFPSKPQMIGALTAAFFVASGLLKANLEWLSGYWFGQTYTVSNKALEWLAAVYIMAEIIAGPMLLSRSGQRLAGAIAALAVVNMVNWSLGEALGPLILNALLLFFVFYFIERRRFEREALYQSYVRPEPTRLWVPVLVGTFILIQALPFLGAEGFNRPTPLTLSQPKIPATCKQYGYLVYTNGQKLVEPGFFSQGLPPEECDAGLRMAHASSLCKKHSQEPGFKTVASVLLTRGYSEADFSVTSSNYNLCNGGDQQ